MLHKFRRRFPNGSIISELLAIDHGKYIVRVLVEVDKVTLASGLAAADKVETAEDMARNRALELLIWEAQELVQEKDQKTALPEPTKAITEPRSESTVVPLRIPEPSSSDTKVIPISPLSRTSEPLRLELPLSTPELTPELTPEIAEEDSPELILEIADEVTPDLFSLKTESLGIENGLKKEETTAKATPTSLEETNPAPRKPSSVSADSAESLDFSDIIARTDIELKRLNWTQEQGRDYLLATYGKKSRLHLSDGELLEFLHYLESQS